MSNNFNIRQFYFSRNKRPVRRWYERIWGYRLLYRIKTKLERFRLSRSGKFIDKISLSNLSLDRIAEITFIILFTPIVLTEFRVSMHYYIYSAFFLICIPIYIFLAYNLLLNKYPFFVRAFALLCVSISSSISFYIQGLGDEKGDPEGHFIYLLFVFILIAYLASLILAIIHKESNGSQQRSTLTLLSGILFIIAFFAAIYEVLYFYNSSFFVFSGDFSSGPWNGGLIDPAFILFSIDIAWGSLLISGITTRALLIEKIAVFEQLCLVGYSLFVIRGARNISLAIHGIL